MKPPLLIPVVSLGLLAAAAPALAIVKCVERDGRVVYTDGKCPAGSKPASRIDTVPPPSAEARARAEAERARLVEEAQSAENAARRRQEAEAGEQRRREERAQRAEEQARLREQQELLRRQTEALEQMHNRPVIIVPRTPPRPLLPPPLQSQPAPAPERRLDVAPVGRRADR